MRLIPSNNGSMQNTPPTNLNGPRPYSLDDIDKHTNVHGQEVTHVRVDLPWTNHVQKDLVTIQPRHERVHEHRAQKLAIAVARVRVIQHFRVHVFEDRIRVRKRRRLLEAMHGIVHATPQPGNPGRRAGFLCAGVEVG